MPELMIKEDSSNSKGLESKACLENSDMEEMKEALRLTRMQVQYSSTMRIYQNLSIK